MSDSNSLSIEISPSVVKLLGLSHRKKAEYQITHASRHIYDSKAVLAETVKRALSEAGAEGATVATSVWASTMVLRKISLPRLKPQEISGALQLEADKYVPFALDECVMDYYAFPQDPQSAKTDVMLVASKKDLILDRCRFLEESGLKLSFMDIHPLALTNWLLLRRPDAAKGVYALVHIGDAPGKFQGEDNFIAVIKDGVPWVIRDLGDRFSPAEVTDEAFVQTAALVANALVFFENMAHDKPKEILLSAHESIVAKLSEAVEKTSRLRPVRWSAADDLTFENDAVQNSFKVAETCFSTALGVAARMLAS